jgi:phytoene dehydrogenase-like protein
VGRAPGAKVPKDANKIPNYAGIDGGIGSESTIDYVRDVLGTRGAQYFFDLNRFRADFADDVDAIGYLEYGMIDYFGSSPMKYPIPGHSAVMEKMRTAIEAKGGRIFLSEPVQSVANASDGSFNMQTSKRAVKAKQVVLAVPHGAYNSLSGDVVSTIKAAKEFSSVTSAKSMQVTHHHPPRRAEGHALGLLGQPRLRGQEPHAPG